VYTERQRKIEAEPRERKAMGQRGREKKRKDGDKV
jgi:hypothetical protein